MRLLGALLCWSMWVVGAARAEIVIGQSAPLSKSNASMGADIRDGALAWFNQVNRKGGIRGEKVRLITLDDENNAAKSAANTETLIATHRAQILFGYASATLSAPALPLAEQHLIPFFAPFTGADVIHDRKDLVYTVRASYRDEMRAIVSMWSGVGLTRFAIVHYDDPVGRQNFETVQKMLEGVKDARATSIAIKRNAEVKGEVLERIRASDAQVVIYTTLAEPIAAILKQIRAAKLFYNMVALSFAGNSQLRDAVGAAGHGLAMTTVVPRYNDGSVAVAREYRGAMAESGFGRLSYASFESFLAAKALTEGLTRAGPTFSRASFDRAMSSMRHLDLGGYSLSFSKERPHGSHYVELAVLDRNGQFKN